MAFTRTRIPSGLAMLGLTVFFGVFVVYLALFARSVLRGSTCPNCGAKPDR